ncbi:hypothetical protein Tco_0325708 [Tanacetum coccineum]
MTPVTLLLEIEKETTKDRAFPKSVGIDDPNLLFEKSTLKTSLGGIGISPLSLLELRSRTLNEDGKV